MILEYHRPNTIDDALELLARTEPITFPLGGGTVLTRASDSDFEVVDLQLLGIDQIKKESKTWRFGAMLTLQTMLTAEGMYKGLAQAIQHQATYNTRHVATVAGALVAADGRSAFATAMLALDAKLSIAKLNAEVKYVALGDFLPLRAEQLQGALIIEIIVPMGVQLAYHYIARTPADLPIVCVALAQWPSGRTRVALGGYGSAPLVAMDGPSADGAETAAFDAYREAADSWASASYRSKMAATLTKRGLM